MALNEAELKVEIERVERETRAAFEQAGIGTVLQISLMALDGYFDSWTACGCNIPARLMLPDWLVTRCIDRGPGHYYRFRVEGVNLNCKPGEYGYRTCDDVPALNWRNVFAPGCTIETSDRRVA